MLLQIVSIFVLMVGTVLCAPGGARQNMMRLARDNNKTPHRSLDPLGGGNLLRIVDPYRSSSSEQQIFLRPLDNNPSTYPQREEVLRMLDAMTSEALDEPLLRMVAHNKAPSKHPKRMLDSVSGWAFGENKRNFDEIDNVGFTGFAKKSANNDNRQHLASLAKKNFDEIDRAGFETYNKRNFDEIDRAGFETYNKRD